MEKDSQLSIIQKVITWSIWPGNSPSPTNLLGHATAHPWREREAAWNEMMAQWEEWSKALDDKAVRGPPGNYTCQWRVDSHSHIGSTIHWPQLESNQFKAILLLTHVAGTKGRSQQKHDSIEVRFSQFTPSFLTSLELNVSIPTGKRQEQWEPQLFPLRIYVSSGIKDSPTKSLDDFVPMQHSQDSLPFASPCP